MRLIHTFNTFLTQYTNIIAYFLIAVFIILGSLISLHRYWQYEVSYVDFGQYDQALWRISRFEPPIVEHFIHGSINVLGDHVTPSIFLIAPLYWFTDRSEMLLLVQAIAVGLSGYVLYDIAKHILKKNILALSILISYFLFVGLQNAVITEFHEITVMTLPLMVVFWAIVKEKKILFFMSLLLTLGFKEITFALGIGIGIAIFFLKKDWRKISIVTILISIAWGILAFKVIIPYFSDGEYLYASTLPEGLFEKIYGFVDHPLKRRTLFFSFLSFSFLPLFAPQFWFTFLQDYAARFLPQNFTTRLDLGMHYNAQSAVLFAVSSVYGLHFLISKLKATRYIPIIALIIILNSFILFRFVLHGPFGLGYNKAFYAHTKDFEFLNHLVSQIPEDATVMTHNNLAVRFSHQKVWILRDNYDSLSPEYILFDTREGQNANNFFGTKNFQKIPTLLKNDPNYILIYKTDEQFIYKRK